MESMFTRQSAVQSVRARVAPVLGHWLNDTECVRVAIACACKDPEQVLGVLLNREKAAVVSGHIQAFAIQEAEWTALFGTESRHAHVQSATSYVQWSEFAPCVADMENALRSTLAESAPKAAWTRAVTKLATFVAMQFANHEDAVAAVLGCVVKADTRRVDELRSVMEDKGQDTLAIMEMISALGEAAC